MLDALVLADGSIKNDALLRIAGRGLQRHLAQAHGFGGNEYPLRIHAVENVLEPLALLADAVRHRDRQAVNKEFINEFYTLFLQDMPQTDLAHFTNRERQHTMLQMAMDVLIDLDKKEALFRQILHSGNHQRFDAAAYERFMDVFIGLAKKTDRKSWNEATELAWLGMRDKALVVVRAVLGG